MNIVKVWLLLSFGPVARFPYWVADLCKHARVRCVYCFLNLLNNSQSQTHIWNHQLSSRSGARRRSGKRRCRERSWLSTWERRRRSGERERSGEWSGWESSTRKVRLTSMFWKALHEGATQQTNEGVLKMPDNLFSPRGLLNLLASQGHASTQILKEVHE